MDWRANKHWRLQRKLNILSHALGFVLAVILKLFANLPEPIESVFYGSIMLLFVSSCCFHYAESTERSSMETFFYKCDVSMIALVVTASCYSHAFTLPQIAWESPLKIKTALIALSLVAAVIFILVWTNGRKTSMLVDSLFVLQVALPTLMFPNWGRIFEAPMVALFVGVACYGIGLLFVLNDRKYYYFHFIWHLWVIAGVVSHHFALVLS